MRSRQDTHLLLLTLLAVPVASAWAGTATNSLTSQTTVTTACNVSGNTLAFGSAINPISGAAVTGSSTLTIECTATTPYTVALSAGVNAGGITNFLNRKMANGAYTLAYQLYVDNGYTQVWGNGTGSSVYSGTGSGGLQNVTIYGRIPSLTGTVPGTYTDTVTVTVTY
ncbi:spore coat U domain-containing protein [Roseateles sp. So40a]|uniref:Csu type fimbrial protein n=1 Tax=Roseateles sp. So40a TaxID=3400226 RepID=UPI003A89669D